MSERCKRVHDNTQPCDQAPDYTQPLEEIREAVGALLALAQAQRAQEVEMFPQPADEDNYYGDTVSAAANAVTTVSWLFLKDYLYYFKSIYSDSHPDCNFIWTFQATTEATGAKVLGGNEHNFDVRPVKAKGGTTLTLQITNTGAVAIPIDIVFLSWARRL